MTRQSAPFDRRLGAHAALATLSLGLMLAAGPAAAVLYKWVDANGRISYSDQPPPGNVKSEIVGGAPPASNPEAVRDMANQEQDLKKRDKQRAEDLKKVDKARAEDVTRQQACTDVKGRLAIYNTDVLVTMVNEKGEQVFLDDAAKNKEREKIEALVRERCPG